MRDNSTKVPSPGGRDWEVGPAVPDQGSQGGVEGGGDPDQTQGLAFGVQGRLVQEVERSPGDLQLLGGDQLPLLEQRVETGTNVIDDERLEVLDEDDGEEELDEGDMVMEGELKAVEPDVLVQPGDPDDEPWPELPEGEGSAQVRLDVSEPEGRLGVYVRTVGQQSVVDYLGEEEVGNREETGGRGRR